MEKHFNTLLDYVANFLTVAQRETTQKTGTVPHQTVAGQEDPVNLIENKQWNPVGALKESTTFSASWSAMSRSDATIFPVMGFSVDATSSTPKKRA